MLDPAFVSTMWGMHPSHAQGAIGEWHQDLPHAMWTRGYVRFGRRLWLATEPRPGSSDPLQLFEVPGVLWLGRPIPVCLECSIWSATTTELAIRPRHLAWPVGTERYSKRIAKLLEDVMASAAGRVAHQPATAHKTPRAISRIAPVGSTA